MSKRPRRNHTPVFKAKVALAAMKGEKTLACPHCALRWSLWVVGWRPWLAFLISAMCGCAASAS